MSFFDWIASIRKKPLEARRRIATLLSLWIMGGVAAVWFIFFFSGLPQRLEKVEGTQNAAPETARSFFSDIQLPPFPEFPKDAIPGQHSDAAEAASSTDSTGTATSSGAVSE